MSAISDIREQKQGLIRRHAQADNRRALTQVLIALGMLAMVWWVAVWTVAFSYWLTLAAILLISLFDLRIFTLMHECGHGSLFRLQRLNRLFGFILGVVAGMPQYVWSRHHSYHHANNGNWEKYRGPYTTLSVDEYASLTRGQQFLYRCKCSIAIAPLVGFIYLIFNPRFTWLKGSIELMVYCVKGKWAQPDRSFKALAASFETRYWRSWKEYWHMSWNNIVLLSGWALMCWGIGSAPFFAIYLISGSLAGGAGILLFTVQHNFKHAYAMDDGSWDFDEGAIAGTSFLVLPRWLNWFTADIGYHHIHHLSAKIPNYHLVACHNEYQSLLTEVTRLTLADVPRALQYILWDRRAQRIISLAEYHQQITPA